MNDNKVVPRLASTVMLLRDEPGDGLQVFMQVRNSSLAFASGALVFPGGSMDADDRKIAAAAATFCDAAALEFDETTRAFRIAAIRETFEECGVLLASRRGAKGLVSGEDLTTMTARHGAALNKGELAFSQFVAREELVLASDHLVHFAHWITPESRPKRFDTHFFAAIAPADQLAAHDGGEAVHSVWIAPKHAVTETDAGRYKLVFATRMNLNKLAETANAKAALAAARQRRVVTITPVMYESAAGERMIRIPAEAGYGGAEFLALDPPAM